MITQIVYLVIAIIVLTLGLAFVCIKGGQLESKIKDLTLLYEHKSNTNKILKEMCIDSVSKCSGEIEQLKKDLSVLEGIQSKMGIELSKMNVLDSKINSLELLVSNLNAFHPVKYKPTVTDKSYDPLNPSGIIYDTDTTESKE